jgi:hypothetical protein
MKLSSATAARFRFLALFLPYLLAGCSAPFDRPLYNSDDAFATNSTNNTASPDDHSRDKSASNSKNVPPE